MTGAGIVAVLFAIAVILGWLLWRARTSVEAVRLRNALLFGVASESELSWRPDAAPPDFKLEQRPPAAEFVAFAREAVGGARGDWPRALAIAGRLAGAARDREPIQSDMLTAYRGIIDEGRGYCADFVDVYLALAHAAGLVARQWGFSFDGFGGHGHALVEVFDRDRGRWLFLDVFNNVHALDPASGEPLGALEMRDFALGRRPAPLIRTNGPGRLGFPIESKLLDYYRRGAAEWYLVWGNNIFSYYGSWPVRVFSGRSRALEQLFATLLGLHPRIRAVQGEENRRQVEAMVELRRHVLGAFAALVVLGTALAALVVLWLRPGAS